MRSTSNGTLPPRLWVIIVTFGYFLAKSVRQKVSIVDEFVCVLRPYTYLSVGQFYLDFCQTGDAEVFELLRQAREDSDTRNQHNCSHNG